MKKTLILAFAVLSLSAVNAVASNKLDLKFLSPAISNPIESDGTVMELTENGGKLMDQSTGEMIEFYHPGAQVDFIIGETVTYILVTLPDTASPAVVHVRGAKISKEHHGHA
jgi:hypothetical protein